jgi:peptidoglycan hydrolase-like protein with peptidoglycan-binding domain
MGYYSSTLQKGSKGDDVKQWQQFLNSQGYSLSVDGDFGDNTLAATTDWQSNNGIGADGIVGEKTWGKAGFTPYSTASTPTAAPTIDTTSYDATQKGIDTLGEYTSAKESVDNYDDFTYADYVESDAVKGAGDALNAHLATKPGEYQSQWQSQLDALMNSIMNREKFSYDLNSDALYQQYKDKYIQQGKMAMQDTMGQAAAMTGGYGNSYAQSVGQQAYQAQLENLNDIVPELYAMALDQYNREGQELYNQYGMVADRENLDYGRYRDTVSDYLTERDYLQGRYDTERGFDYSKYVDDRNLEYTLHHEGYQRLMDSLGIAQGDYYNGADMHYTEQNIKNNQAWEQAKWDETARQYANEEAWRQKEWAENQRRYEEGKVASSGSGSNGGGNGGGNNTGGATYANTLWNPTGTYDSQGNPVFMNSEGKTQAFGAGVNPYTGTKHPDAKKGTFSNGYQPNNIGGTKLKNSGMSTSITGKSQTIWEANGKYWLWRGDLNKYIEVDVSDLG